MLGRPKKPNEYWYSGAYADKKIANNLSMVGGILNYYREILSQMSELAKKLNLKEPLDYAHLFEYLLTNGYLSVRHTFRYQRNIKLQEVNGMNIMSGEGNCLNQASMLHNFFEHTSHEAYMIAVRTIVDTVLPKHVQVLIKNDRNYWVFDPTMHLYGLCDKHIDTFDPDGNPIQFSYISTMFRINNHIDEYPKRINYLDEHKLKLIKKRSEFNSGALKVVYSNPIYSYFDQNRSIIDDFYYRNYENIATIDAHNRSL